MSKKSAGLLPYRRRQGRVEVFLVHPGGPLWAKKDQGAWSIAKGEYGADEDPLTAARREFQEETGFAARGEVFPLTPRRQASGKIISVWAIEMDLDPTALRSNTFQLIWPPQAGQVQEFPEVDRAAWFDLATAQEKIHPGQRGFLEELATRLADQTSPPCDSPA